MLKLRISRPLVGCVRSVTTLGAKKSKEEVLKAADRLAQHFSPALPSTELFAQAMWYHNDNERYRRVKAAYRGLTLEEQSQSESVTSAFLLANAETHEPWKAKKQLTSFTPEAVTPSMVTFLLHGYAVVDSLGSAERLMQSWMQVYLAKHPSDNETAELLRTLRAGSASASTPESEDSKTYDLTATSVGDHTIPLSAWVAMLTVYGKRKAWRQCTDILRYLEHKRDTGAAYTVPQLQGSDVVLRNLDEVLHPTYLVTTDYLQVNHVAQSGVLPSFKQKSNLTRGANAGNVAALQWGALYHITLRALCETMQYEQVVEVLRRMKTAGEEQGALNPQIPAAIALLGALWSPINPLQELSDIDSSSNGSLRDVITAEDPVQRCVQLRRHLAGSLRADVTAAVTALAVPETYVKESQDTDAAAAAAGRSHNGTTANMLAREYVTVLCKLDLLEECKQFISEVQAHVLDVRYGRPNRHNAAGSAFSAGQDEQPVFALTKVSGFWNNNWMAPYFRRAREHSSAAEVEALYAQLHASARFDDSVRRTYLSNASKEDGAWKYKRILRRQEAGNVRGSDAITPEAVDYRKRNHLFHDTAATIRASGDISKLADHMTRQRI